MKSHPATIDGFEGISVRDIEKLISKHVETVRSDDSSRSKWLSRHREFRDRRYLNFDRHTSWPWPGASDTVVPVEDTKIEEMKSVFVRVFFGAPQAIDMVLHRADPVLKQIAISDALYNNWDIRHGQRDFVDQMVIAFDSMMQYGIGPVKTFWEYRSQKVNRVFRRRDFLSRYPELLNQLVDMGARALFLEQPGSFLGERNGASKVLSGRVLEVMRPIIIRDYDLDPDEKTDAKAIDRIMQGLKSGEDNIIYQTIEVLYDLPRSVAVDPKDVIVPPNATITHRSRTTHRLWLAEESFIQHANDYQWSKSAVEQVLDSGSDPTGSNGSSALSLGRLQEIQRDFQEGVFSFPVKDRMFEVWECHWHLKKNETGSQEKVWAMIHPSTKTLLTDIHYEPYEHGEDPFDFLRFEMNSQRFYSSRGLCEKLSDVSWEITEDHRAKRNYKDMQVPAFTKLVGSMLEAGDVNFIPGEFYEVATHDALKPIQVPDYTLQEDRSEQMNWGLVEKIAGGTDIRSSQQSIHEARTATEIDALRSVTRDLLGYRLFLGTRGLTQVIEKRWDLFNQWGKSSVYQQVTGRRFVRKSKTEIRNNYEIQLVGRLDSTDPTIARTIMAQMWQTILQAIQVNGGLVFNNQYRVNLGEMIRMFLDTFNPLTSRAVLEELTEEERAQLAGEEAQARQMGLALRENLPLSEREQLELVGQVAKASPHGKRQRLLAG